MISGNVEKVADGMRADSRAHAPQTVAQELPVTESHAPSAKSSLAIPIWTAVILGVLGCLWLQTRTEVPSYNFLIEGSPNTKGAVVVVDGQPAGKLDASETSGLKTVSLKLHLADGQHSFVVTKPGFKPFSSELKLKGEDYLSVDLTSDDAKDK